MPSIGTFHNQNVVIEWVGFSQRNGQQCAVIDYRAYLNPVNKSPAERHHHAGPQRLLG